MSELTPERLAELRRVAETATQGEWECENGRPYAKRDDHRRVSLQYGFSPHNEMRWRDEADGEFIATFDPPTVQAMIAEIERLRRERDMHRAGKSAALKACDEYLEQVERLRGTLSGLVNAVKRYNSANAFSPGFDHAVARLHEQLSEAERVLEGGDGDE